MRGTWGGGENGAGKLQGGKKPELKPAELVTSTVQNVPLPLELGTPLDERSRAPLHGKDWACLRRRADVGKMGEPVECCPALL